MFGNGDADSLCITCIGNNALGMHLNKQMIIIVISIYTFKWFSDESEMDLITPAVPPNRF